jgi:hypothetical protein
MKWYGEQFGCQGPENGNDNYSVNQNSSFKMKSRRNKILFITTILCLSGIILKAQELYVGANYHPHDNKEPDKIKDDIQLLRAAGLNVVRMGHLAWDSYEPSEKIA